MKYHIFTIILFEAGVFRRETVSGFYPWGMLQGYFYVFVSVPPSIYPRNRGMLNEKKSIHIGGGCGCLVLLSVWLAIIQLCRRYRALL